MSDDTTDFGAAGRSEIARARAVVCDLADRAAESRGNMDGTPEIKFWMKFRMKSGMTGVETLMMIVLFIVLARNKLRIPLEGTYSREM